VKVASFKFEARKNCIKKFPHKFMSIDLAKLCTLVVAVQNLVVSVVAVVLSGDCDDR
jgi:hypothetical protein